MINLVMPLLFLLSVYTIDQQESVLPFIYLDYKVADSVIIITALSPKQISNAENIDSI